jgi:hypothetical protein
LKSIATVAGSGTLRNQTGDPLSSTINGPHSPVPEAGVRKIRPAAVAFAGVVIVTSGRARRSGRDRYFGGAGWASACGWAGLSRLSAIA